MSLRLFVPGSLLLLSVLACAGGGEGDDDADDDKAVEGKEESKKEEAKTEEAKPVIAPAEPGKLPVDFPKVGTSLVAGAKVWAPKRAEVDESFTKTNPSISYYEGELVAPGDVESTVKIGDVTQSVPNSAIIGIPGDPIAKPGDLVVAMDGWSPGRMLVTGGTPAEPKVTCLDTKPEYACKDRSLKAGYFMVLSEPGQVGSTIICKDGGDYIHGTLLAHDGDRVLISSFAREARAFDGKTCKALPLDPKVKKDDKIFVPVNAKYLDGTVLSVEPDARRATIRYKWVSDVDESFSLLDVAATLEPMGLAAAPSHPPGAAPAAVEAKKDDGDKGGKKGGGKLNRLDTQATKQAGKLRKKEK